MVLIVVAALTAAYLITPRTPRYVSETTLLLGSVPTDIGPSSEELNSQRLTGLTLVALTYIQMIQSSPVAQETVRQYDLGMSAESLTRSITAFNTPGTQLLVIQARHSDPRRAQLMADGVAESFMNLLERQREIQQGDDPEATSTLAPVSVYAEASLPTTPLDNGLFQNLLLGLLFGVLVAVGVALVLEYVDLTLRLPEDIERHTGLPVLGVIPMSQELTNRSVIVGAASKLIRSRADV